MSERNIIVDLLREERGERGGKVGRKGVRDGERESVGKIAKRRKRRR